MHSSNRPKVPRSRLEAETSYSWPKGLYCTTCDPSRSVRVCEEARREKRKSEQVDQEIAQLQAAGVPLAGVWIQDWAGMFSPSPRLGKRVPPQGAGASRARQGDGGSGS